ncbi:hypothetical protein IFM89_033949 [Coptis chinensis]|uniref:Uncharacterized protein n=1 Tax=Coptis chinensis TaxID=261450 RepID=A0A835M1K2_9MAGN|nr:hypothetical protein IFM89_033949 [Coptis chinensis]
MGKKVSWFSAIKKAFTPNSKQKLVNDQETEKKISSKKWGLGKIKNGGTTSFILLYRKPSSIEKILGNAEKEQQIITRHTSDEPRTSSIPITARRNFRALKGMVRLQGVVRGQNVKRQTINAMKQMQRLVKVQSQRYSQEGLTCWKARLCNIKIYKRMTENFRVAWEGLNRLKLARMKNGMIVKRRNRGKDAEEGGGFYQERGYYPIPLFDRIEQQLPKQSADIKPKNKMAHASPALDPSPRPQSKQSRFGIEKSQFTYTKIFQIPGGNNNDKYKAYSSSIN